MLRSSREARAERGARGAAPSLYVAMTRRSTTASCPCRSTRHTHDTDDADRLLRTAGCRGARGRGKASPSKLRPCVMLRVDQFRGDSLRTVRGPQERPGQLSSSATRRARVLVPGDQSALLRSAVPRPTSRRHVRRLSFARSRCSTAARTYSTPSRSQSAVRPTTGRDRRASTLGLGRDGDQQRPPPSAQRFVDLDRPAPARRSRHQSAAGSPTVDERELEQISASCAPLRVGRTRPPRRSTPGAGGSTRRRALCAAGSNILQLDDDERAVVVDYKTNSLKEGTPEEDASRRSPACSASCTRSRAHAQIYHFLERPDAVA